MKPALAVIHGEEDATCRRVRALAGDRPLIESMRKSSHSRLAVAHADEVDAEALEPLARDVRAHEEFFVVHLLTSLGTGGSVDVQGLLDGLSEVQQRLLRQFPAARLVQWCVLQAGRDLDPVEAALLVELHDRKTSLGLRGILVVPTSTTLSIAGDASDSRSYAADVVYSLLRGSLRDDLPELTAVATTSVCYRAQEAAQALAGHLAADIIRTEVLRHSDATENHAAPGREAVRALHLSPRKQDPSSPAGGSQVDALVARSTSTGTMRPITLKSVLVRDRPDVVLAHAEEQALILIPDVMDRARSVVPQQLDQLRSAIGVDVEGYLRQSGRTRATWEFLQGLREQLDDETRHLADAADGVDAPALDAAYHAAVVAARRVPSTAGTAVRGAGLALIPMAAALLPGLPWAGLPLLLAGALATGGALLAAGGSVLRHRAADTALRQLQAAAERRTSGLIQRGALLLVRDMTKQLAAWVGDVRDELEGPRLPSSALAGQLQALHEECTTAASVLAPAGTGIIAYPDLEPTRFAMVLPDVGPLLSEGAPTESREAVTEARSRIRGVFETWTLTWDHDQIVAACISRGEPPIADALPHNLDQAVSEGGPTETNVRELLARDNSPRLRSHETECTSGGRWRSVFVNEALQDRGWLPPDQNTHCEMDDQGFVAALNLVSLQMTALRSIAARPDQNPMEGHAAGGMHDETESPTSQATEPGTSLDDGTDFVVGFNEEAGVTNE